MLGLNLGQNILVASDPAWTQAFEAERRSLLGVLAGLARGIEHYGSTAVTGLRAKPIIDILVGLDTLDAWHDCREPLARLGYTYFADAGVEGHHVFRRGNASAERTHLLHLVAIGSSHWSLNLAFRDRLRGDAQLRARYESEKEQAAARAPSDRVTYNALKSRFIQAVMADIASKGRTP